MAAATIADSFRYLNYGEAAVWCIVAALAWKAARDRGAPRAGNVLAATFVLFGLSDVVETTTGAWWRPWWLFAWKAACVVVVVGTLLAIRITRRRASIASDQPPAE